MSKDEDRLDWLREIRKRIAKECNNDPKERIFFACPHRGKATTKKEYRIMNKECRMSKESGLINFIILHSIFLVRYSKMFSRKITNMKSWGKNFHLKTLYIKLF
jgi:gluconate kinase